MRRYAGEVRSGARGDPVCRVKAEVRNQSGTASYARLWSNSGAGFFMFGGEEMRLKETIEAYRRNDPAARSNLEVFFLYNGLHAVMYYRVAHWFYTHGMKFIGRWVSQIARRRTGVEIHPAAKIGRRLVIDHGTGIVIGATAEIGDDCLLYQGVTLGGTGAAREKRHPTLGNNVMVGCGAKVLGPFKVGDNARIAANSVVLEEVPANSTVVGVPGRVVRLNGEKLDHIHTPDPIRAELDYLHERVEWLEKQMKEK